MAGNIKVGGHTVFTHTGAVGAGTVTLKDQSGNAILTDDGTTVAIGNVDTATVGSNALVVDSSGNVGIGTGSPSQTLSIRNAADNQIRVENGASATQSYEFGRNGTTGLLTFYGNQTGFTGYVFSGVDGERMRIDTSGNVIIPNGITLGAGGTYNAANTLDDYEEGTWTPRIKGNGNNNEFTATTRNGTYTKIGRLVNLTCEYVYTSTADNSLYSFMEGAPFLPSATVAEFSVYIIQGASDTSVYSGRYMGTYYIAFHKNQNSTSPGWMTGGNFPSSGTVYFTMSFITP